MVLCVDPLANALVINLEGAAGARRRKAVTEEFEHAGLREVLQFMPAIVGSSVAMALSNRTKIYAEAAVRGAHRFKIPGSANVYALSLSHRQVYDYILQHDIDCATIFEVRDASAETCRGSVWDQLLVGSSLHRMTFVSSLALPRKCVPCLLRMM